MGSLTISGLSRSVEAAVRARLAEPELDVVVAGAGRQPTGRFLDIGQADWEAAVDAAKEAFRAAQQAAAGWEAAEAPGRVVFVVSSASLRPVQGDALDAAAGGFLTTIGQVGAVELGGKGITVNTVVHGRLEGEDDAGFVDGIPAGRLGRPRRSRTRSRSWPRTVVRLTSTARVLAVDGGFWITKTPGGSPLGR